MPRDQTLAMSLFDGIIKKLYLLRFGVCEHVRNIHNSLQVLRKNKELKTVETFFLSAVNKTWALSAQYTDLTEH